MFNSKKDNLREFTQLLAKLAPEEFIGLTRILCVRCFEDEKQQTEDGWKLVPRDAALVVEDCIVAFDKMNRKRRREITQILRAVAKEKR